MISTIKLSGPNVSAIGDRIAKNGFGCLDRIDSMQLCSMLLGITSNNYGESTIVDITNGILNSCGDQSHQLGLVLTNKFRLGAVWKFTTDYGLSLILSKLPREGGRNVIRITAEYEILAKDLDGSEYEAVVSRPLIEYSSEKIGVFKIDCKENFVKGEKNRNIFQDPDTPDKVVPEQEEPTDDQEEDDGLEPENEDEEEIDDEEEEEPSNESISDDDGQGTESPATEGPDAGEPEPGDGDGDDAPGPGGESGSESGEGSGEDAGLTEQEEPMDQEEPVQRYGTNSVSVDFIPEWANTPVSEIDDIINKDNLKEVVTNKVLLASEEPEGVPLGLNNEAIADYTEKLLTKILEDKSLEKLVKEHNMRVGGVRYSYNGGYVVEVMVDQLKEVEELQEAMNSDKSDTPVQHNFVDIQDPEYRNGTLMAMFGTTAPSANHVHTYLNDYHNQAKTKSFLETKIDGQGTYPTESDVFYDDVVWAFVKMKDGRFWRIAIARRDFGLEDESWIATHHIPGRWVTLAEVQDGPSFHGYNRRRNW